MLRAWSATPTGSGLCFALAPLAAEDHVNWIKLAMVLVVLILSLGAHEAAHAWVALKCGDPTGRDLGRLTLNPIPHIDPWMTVLLPALLFFSAGIMFGGAKPVPVQFHRLRHPWRDMSLVAIAGPLTNLVIAVLLLAAFRLFVETGWYNGAAETRSARVHDLLPSVLFASAGFNVLLFVFNLVPIPPLDGSRVLAWLLPSNLRDSYVALERWGMFLVIGLVFFTPVGRHVGRSVDVVTRWVGALVWPEYFS